MGPEKAILVEGVAKSFKIPLDKVADLKQVIVNYSKRKKGYRLAHILEDISFEVEKGEFFGIVGRNGSGKSTLLKLLAGIYVPDKGGIAINGTLTPFIELGVGFNPELTGRENIFLNGALLGLSRKEVESMYDEIVDFAELHDFMEERLRNYSSGMQVRLAFSIAIRAKSNILLMDEVLAVGDAVFQKKCFDAFRRLKKEGRTIILVTHDMSNVERFCDRALVLDKGRIIDVTTPHEAAVLYNQLNAENQGVNEKRSEKRWGSGKIKIDNPRFIAKDNKNIFYSGDDIRIEFDVVRSEDYRDSSILAGLAIFNQDDQVICGPNTKGMQINTAHTINAKISKIPFAPGDYKVTLALFNEEGTETHDVLDKWLSFTVLADHDINGLIEVEANWEFK